MTYEELVRRIGHGFHPDTPGVDYAELPEGITPELVDEVVSEAWDIHDGALSTDPYARAYAILHDEK